MEISEIKKLRVKGILFKVPIPPKLFNVLFSYNIPPSLTLPLNPPILTSPWTSPFSILNPVMLSYSISEALNFDSTVPFKIVADKSNSFISHKSELVLGSCNKVTDPRFTNIELLEPILIALLFNSLPK